MNRYSGFCIVTMLLATTSLSAQQAAKAPDPVMEAIALRQRENAKRMASPALAGDMARGHISAQQIEWMRQRLCPLGFENPHQYQQFRRELLEVLHRGGLEGVHVGLTGTSTTFYSENPRKPIGHFFDENAAEPADLDLNLSGAPILKRMQSAGKKAHPVIPDIYRSRDVSEVFPAIHELAEKWSRILHREMTFVAMTSLDPWRSPSEYVVVQGAR